MPRNVVLESRSLSCNACRESRVRCIRPDYPSSSSPASQQQPCHRCVRRGLNCISEASKRKYATSLRKDKKRAATSSTSISASPTPIGPAEDAGYPSLSNPLKLLAHASQHLEQDSIFPQNSIFPRLQDGKDQQHSSTVSRAVETSNVSLWRASFGAGMYTPRYEDKRQCDPIACGIITTSRAAALFHRYMDVYNVLDGPLDPEWHTFEYLCRHPFLSTVLYWVVSKDEEFEGAEELNIRLYDHIQKDLMPKIMENNYRSVEIVLGMLLLAGTHFVVRYTIGEQSWIFLGHAIRMGIELDLNARIVSTSVDEEDEHTIRQYRSHERLVLVITSLRG